MIDAGYLCLDQGGHAGRAVLISAEDGRVLDVLASPVAIHAEGQRAEQDPLALLESMQSVIGSAVQHDDVRLLAAGLATQRAPVMCWRRGCGEPLSQVLGWQDRRAASLLPDADDILAEIQRRTGLVANAHYGATKLRWCLDHLEPVRRALEEDDLIAGPLAAFLIQRLTGSGRARVDHINASRTMLLNRHDLQWDKWLLECFRIPRSILADVVPSLFDYGVLQGTGIPLRLVIGDQAAVPFAYGPPDAHTLYLNMGTGAFLQRPVSEGEEVAPPLLASPLPQAPGWAMEGTVNGAASALDIATGTGVDGWRKDLDLVPGLSVDAPMFLNGIGGLGSPDWRSGFESRFVGNGDVSGRTAAVAESILFLIRRNLDAMNRQLPPPHRILASGGLAASDALCQALADLTRIEVQRPACLEATALGVAVLLGAPATMATGSGSRIFTPAGSTVIEERYRRWSAALEDALENGHG